MSNKFRLIAFTMVISILVYLGCWQLGRAQQKRELQTPASISLQGQLLLENIFLLDNQILNKNIGYRIVLPLAVQNQKSWKIFLLDCGWISKKDLNKKLLPENLIKIFAEKIINVEGLITKAPKPLLLKKEQFFPEQSLIILQKIDFELISKYLHKNHQQLSFEMQPILVVLEDPAKYGFEFKAMALGNGIGAERHLGYAVQWFGLGVVAVVILVRRCFERSLSS